MSLHYTLLDLQSPMRPFIIESQRTPPLRYKHEPVLLVKDHFLFPLPL